jgi:palmitoyl-protein thioesterase
LQAYYAAGSFLADINNEMEDPEARNGTYKENFTSLENLVMILFSRDRTVVPKESSWFGSEAPPPEDELNTKLWYQRPASSQAPERESAVIVIPDARQSVLSEAQMGRSFEALDGSYSFAKDTVQGESAVNGQRWPGSEPPKTIIPMRLQPLYLEDWFGLRTLDERGGVHLETCEGEHMEVRRECWEPLVRKYVGQLVIPSS